MGIVGHYGAADGFTIRLEDRGVNSMVVDAINAYYR